MSIALANTISLAVLAYAAVGALFALAFAFVGVNRIDPVAKSSGWTFRVLILPGVAALWPLMAYRWAIGSPPPTERNAHRTAAGAPR